MHGVIEPEQNLVKLTSDDVQQNCAKCTKPLPFLALWQRLPTWRLERGLEIAESRFPRDDDEAKSHNLRWTRGAVLLKAKGSQDKSPCSSIRLVSLSC
jgi:hypothetical protein